MYTEVSNLPTMFREQCRVSLGVLKNESAVHNDNKRDQFYKLLHNKNKPISKIHILWKYPVFIKLQKRYWECRLFLLRRGNNRIETNKKG